MNGAGRRALAAVREFTVAQRALALIGVAVLVLGGVALTMFAGKPTYSPLFTGLSGSDASAIVAQLQKDKVDYQLSDGGATILVPADKVDAERLGAAAAGLPSASTGGYALLDNMGVTASEFQQNVTYQRAIEGELAKTIGSINGVRSASVHLAIPKQSVFVSQTADPTASVFVDPSAPLTSDQVQAIVHLTSAAVGGLKDSNVTVVDSKGNTLSAVGGGPTGSTAQQASDYESRTRTAVQAMLDSVLGPGNSTVTVSADISASSGTSTTRSYSVPAGSPTLSQSTDKSAYKGTGGGAASGTLGSDVSAGATSSAGGNGTYGADKTVKNNALNSLTEVKTITPGTLNRQTIAVAVNAAKVNGIAASTIQNLVSAAAGVNTKRGDSVTVATASFSNAAAQTATAALAQSAAQQSADNTNRLITTAIQVVGGLLALVILIVVLRKLFKKPEPAAVDAGELNVFPLAAPAAPEHPLGQGHDAAQLGSWGAPASGRPVGTGPDATSLAATAVLPVGAGGDASGFGRLQSDIDTLAGADPERAAEYLRALMADRVDR